MCIYFDILPGDVAIYLPNTESDDPPTCIHMDAIIAFFQANLQGFSGVIAPLCMWYRMLRDPERSGWVIRLHQHRSERGFPNLLGVDLFPTLHHTCVGDVFDKRWLGCYKRLGVRFDCAAGPRKGSWYAERVKVQTMAELKVACEQPPRPRFFVAVDTEGLGCNQRLYPTVALAFAVFDDSGKLYNWWKINFPYEISEKLIEPRCWREFWNNPEKCDPKIYQQLVQDCKKAMDTFPSVQRAWQEVRRVIDEFYERFDSPGQPLTWVSDCPDYDVGRIDAALGQFIEGDDPGLRYRVTGGDPAQRHWVEDCGSGKDVMQLLRPRAYRQLKAELEASPYKKNHDCLEDAKRIGFEYVTCMRIAKACVPRGGAKRKHEGQPQAAGNDPYAWIRVGALALFDGIPVKVRNVSDVEVELIAINSSALYVLFRQDRESLQKLVPFTV